MISIRVIDMEKRVIYYARVSSKDQNLARQLEAFRTAGEYGSTRVLGIKKQIGAAFRRRPGCERAGCWDRYCD